MENKVKIKIGEFEFEASGEAEVVERERKAIFDLIPSIVSSNNCYKLTDSKDIDNMSLIPIEEQPKQLKEYSSINHFINEKKFANSIDLTLGVIYYVANYENTDVINKNVLKEYYDKSKEKLPTNISQNLNNLTQKGYIKTLDKGEKGTINYSITNQGETYIQEYEPKENSKKTKKNTVKKISNAKEEVVSLTRDSLKLHEYKKMKEIKDFKGKMMLALYIVSENSSVKSFSVNDISYILTNIFQESNTVDQIKGVIKREPTWFNKVKNEDTKLLEYSLLREGNEFAESIAKEGQNLI